MLLCPSILPLMLADPPPTDDEFAKQLRSLQPLHANQPQATTCASGREQLQTDASRADSTDDRTLKALESCSVHSYDVENGTDSAGSSPRSKSSWAASLGDRQGGLGLFSGGLCSRTVRGPLTAAEPGAASIKQECAQNASWQQSTAQTIKLKLK